MRSPTPIPVALLCSFFCMVSGAADPPRPNVLLIMADDMGYSDLGCYGSEIKTPHLDKLAANGLRFTNFYNEGRCWPTRAALMTGRNAHDVGHAMNRGPKAPPAYQGTTRDRAPMIPELLASAGYHNYHVGKWHLNNHSFGPEKNRTTWAIARGFERSYSIESTTFVNYFNPAELRIDGKVVKYIGRKDPDYYYTDALTERTLTDLDDHINANPDAPFFVYLAHYAPHHPLHAHPKDIEKYRGKYRIGWDEMRHRRHEKMTEMGIYKGELSPRDPAVPSWDSLSEEEQVKWDERMAIHAAMVECMDRGIGRVVDWLEKNNRLDNTLIFFLSDNGADRSSGGHKKTQFHQPGAAAGSRNSYVAIETPWSNASNTPFRQHKARNHEGGIATPLIVHWPTGIGDEQRGSITHQVSRVNDILPTIVELAGIEVPSEVTGKSLLPYFEKPGVLHARTLYWEHLGNRAVRRGDWKLVALNKKPWELYNLSVDPAELRDLSKQEQELKQELQRLWEQWAKKVGYVPRGRK